MMAIPIAMVITTGTIKQINAPKSLAVITVVLLTEFAIIYLKVPSSRSLDTRSYEKKRAQSESTVLIINSRSGV